MSDGLSTDSKSPGCESLANIGLQPTAAGVRLSRRG
jgi:hypothetical protein